MTMQGKFNCAIYTRVSTDTQAEKDFSSCEAQEEKIRAFIKSQNNWKVFKVYSDAGFTGANLNRPALQELLEDIKQGGINIVLVYKIDRLTRSPRDFYQLIEIFDRYKVDFISITERFDTSTPAGRLLRNIMLTFAQFERELASERTKDKMLERAKKGLWNGGLVSYGYKKENKKLVINPKEAEIVRFIYESYITKGSLAIVYKELKEKGIKNRQGKFFTKSHLENILRNIVYIGKIKYSGKVYEGIHEPLISEEVFNLAQQIHKEKIRKLRLYKEFLFGGLIICNECGSRMTSSFTNKHTVLTIKTSNVVDSEFNGFELVLGFCIDHEPLNSYKGLGSCTGFQFDFTKWNDSIVYTCIPVMRGCPRAIYYECSKSIFEEGVHEIVIGTLRDKPIVEPFLDKTDPFNCTFVVEPYIIHIKTTFSAFEDIATITSYKGE